MRKWIFLIGLGGLGLGSFLYYRRQLALLYNFKWTIKDIRVQKLSLSDTQLLVTVEIINDADISFTITGYDFDAFVDGKKVARIVNKSVNVAIPRMGVPATLTFLVSMNPSEMGIRGIISTFISSARSMVFSLKGTVSVKMSVFTFRKFPLEIEYTMRDFT